MRKNLCILVLGLIPGLQASAALGQARDDTFLLFTTCAGRLSALVEHQWIVDGPASEQTARQRDAMVALVDAVMPREAQVQAMARRLEAKVAHAALLQRVTFLGDQTARARAEALVTQCLDLIGQS